MTTTEIVPAEYRQASSRFRNIWVEYIEREEKSKDEIVNMIKILESIGYNRTKAIEKIVTDHSDLKGFSRATIYRELPDNTKRRYANTDEKPPIVSNETFNMKSQENDPNVANITSSDETPYTEEDKFTSNTNHTPTTIEVTEEEAKQYQTYLEEKRKREEIKKQLPAEVGQYADDVKLTTDKLEMIARSRLKKERPGVLETVIDQILYKDDKAARDKIAQTTRNLETGYFVRTDNGYFYGDPDKRDLIKGNKREVKDPGMAYLEIIGSIHKLCENLTGHKLEKGEFKYTLDHFKYTKEYRQEIIRNNCDKRELIVLNNQLVLIADYADDFIAMIKEALDDFDKKPNTGI